MLCNIWYDQLVWGSEIMKFILAVPALAALACVIVAAADATAIVVFRADAGDASLVALITVIYAMFLIEAHRG